jgi:chromosome segregation ATPase
MTDKCKRLKELEGQRDKANRRAKAAEDRVRSLERERRTLLDRLDQATKAVDVFGKEREAFKEQNQALRNELDFKEREAVRRTMALDAIRGVLELEAS